MPIDHAIDRDLGIVRATWTGRITAAEVAEAWRRSIETPESFALGRTLTDLRAADVSFSSEELRGLVREIILPMLQGRIWRSAILVTRPVHYGMSRQFSVFAEPVTDAAVFYDEAEALRWLLADGR